MFRDRVLDRWVALEMRGLSDGLVARRKSLAALLQEERPHCLTREGEERPFDPDVLLRLAAVTSEEERSRLRLPITLTFSAEAGDECRVDDDLAGEVLRRLEKFGKAYPVRDGRMWLPSSLGVDLLRRYPTAFQRMLVP